MNSILQKLFSTTILYLFSALSFANTFPTSFVSISNQEGLSSNRINTIFKDSRGFIWLGTQIGINRFDGNVVKQYNQIGNEEVFCIEETNEVDLWIGTENGLRKLDRVTNKVENIELGIERLAVKDILSIGNNRLFLATNRGLFLIENDNIQHIIFENGLSNSNSLTSITHSDSANYWFASLSGICHYNLDTKKASVYKSNYGDSYNNFTSIECVDSVLYAGSYNKGIITFNIKSGEFSFIKDFQDTYVLDIKCYEKDLYVGTNGGGLKIYSLNTKQITGILRHELKDPNSISSNAIYSFLLDEGVFWIGTYNAGLNYNPRINNYFQIYKEADFNSYDYNVRSFWLNENGDKLIGTRSGLIYLSKQKNISKQFNQNDNSILSSDIILYIAPYDSPNEFLIGTYGGGMYTFNSIKMSLSRLIKEDVFLNGCVFRFTKDKNNIWWIATDRGLFEFHPETKYLANYSTTNSGLINNNILYLYEDSKNRIWLATSDGLCLFDKSSKTIKSNILPGSKDIKVITYVFEDSESNIWLASHQAFAKLNASLNSINLIQLNQENIGVMSIIEDNNKDIWIATNQGIIKYNILDSKYKTYNISDGILSYNFANIVQKTTENDFWWANENGLIHCYLPDLDKRRNTQRPVITNILYKNESDQSVSPEFTNKLYLSSGENDIRFELSLLNYSLPKSNVYEYILEGYDKDWRSQIGKNEVSYYGIPPGKHTFRVRNVNDSSIETSVEIIVHHNYNTAIWLTIIILVLVLVVLLLYKNRILAKRKIQEHSDPEKYVYSKIQDSEAKNIIKQLENYMETNKPFLNQDLKQVDVAKNLKISSAELSQVLNQFLGVNFPDYVNKFRIEELVKRMKDKSSTRYTLDALAEKCGFSSRSSFFRAIKKQTGQTPAEFLRKYDAN